MIIKKLAVPFINEKLLQQVQHCYIATAAITAGGFDFIRTRIPTTTKMEIVTGLQMPSDPDVLFRIWRNYQGRITLNIFTKNVLHANVYIFDLPYRKSVAFIGSGQFTLEGVKDNEELFYKVTDIKDIENLKSWFIGYYEFAQPLTDTLIDEYAMRYPLMKQRDHVSRLEKEQFLALTTAGFSWDQIRFKLQYFKKDDYLSLSTRIAEETTEETQAGRVNVHNKLLGLHDLIKDHLRKLGLHTSGDNNAIVSSLDPAHHDNNKLTRIWLTYGRSATELKKFDQGTSIGDLIHAEIAVNQNSVGVYLLAEVRKGRSDREYLKTKMNDVEYRKQFYSLVAALGPGYWIDVACERRNIGSFPNEDVLWEFMKTDQWAYFHLVIGKTYTPDSSEISNDNIAPVLMKEFDKLALLYRLLKAKDE